VHGGAAVIIQQRALHPQRQSDGVSMMIPGRGSIGLMISAALMTLSMASALGQAVDSVLLNNGDRISGHIVASNAETVTVQTDGEGVVTIRKDFIGRVTSVPPLVRQNQAAPQSPTVAEKKLVGAQTSTPARPSEHCATLSPVTWSLQFQGAPNEVVVGTVSQDLFGGGVNVSLCDGDLLNQTNFAAAGSHSRFYEHGSGAIVADVADAELEQQRFFRSEQGAAMFVLGDAFNNNALGMAMQKSFGIGLMSPQYRYRSTAYDFAADARYLNQHLDSVSPALNLAAVRLKEQMHTQGKLFRLDEEAWIMPALNDIHALQGFATLAPSFALKPWLTLGISEEENYLENAPYPRRKNYFTSTLSLTIQGGTGSRTK
jgi:hypothetical protein